jgi:D-alanyl-D-alanine carboxypeptidase
MRKYAFHIPFVVLLLVLAGALAKSASQPRENLVSGAPQKPPRFLFADTLDSGGHLITQPGGDALKQEPPGPPPASSAGAIKAHAAWSQSLKDGTVWYKKNGQEQWPIASLTKLVTAVVASRFMSADDEIIVRKVPGSWTDRYDTRELLKEGERYRMRDLQSLMLVVSSNEAAEAIAYSYGFSDFMRKMNDQAQEWGLEDTYFDEPTGLSVANQSTPEDLAALASRLVVEYPHILDMTSERTAVAVELASGRQVAVSTTNEFAGQPDFLGGKTGYTDDAQGNLLSVFNRSGSPVVIVVLGSGDRFGETRKLLGQLPQ